MPVGPLFTFLTRKNKNIRRFNLVKIEPLNRFKTFYFIFVNIPTLEIMLFYFYKLKSFYMYF